MGFPAMAFLVMGLLELAFLVMELLELVFLVTELLELALLAQVLLVDMVYFDIAHHNNMHTVNNLQHQYIMS